jgi:hypothetical protein
MTLDKDEQSEVRSVSGIIPVAKRSEIMKLACHSFIIGFGDITYCACELTYGSERK